MKLYSYNFELLAYLDDVVVSYDGVLGNISTLTFTFPKYQYDHAEGKMVEDSRYNYIVNEAVIEYDGEHYLIKEAIPLREGTYVAKEVVCKSLAVEWSGTKVDGHWGFSPMIDHFEYPYNEPATLEMALNDLIGKYLNGWSIGVLPEVEKRRTFDFEWSTPMQIITDLAKVYDYTPRFRTEIVDGELKKYIDILDKDYGDIKGYYRHDSTLDTIRIPINTDAITTRLFLFGYDNLTINDLPEETKEVNGVTYPIHEKGKSYIQNFDYYLTQGYTYEDCLEKFVKVDYESDDLYVDAEDLYQYGKERIAQIGVPQMAYTVSIKDIEFSGKPKIELGHNIRVVDEELNIDMICRVSKISYTSDDKENKTIEITNYATYMTEMDLLTDLMVKHENLSQGAIKKYSKFAGSLVFSDNTGLTVQAPVEGQMTRASTDSLEGKLVRDVVKLGIYEKDKYGIQILDGQLQLDREDGLTRVKIDNTEGIIIYNNPEADGFTDDHRVFYVDNEGNLVAEKITVRNGFFYLKDGQEIEAVIGGINNSIGNIEGSIDGIEGSISEIEREQVRLDELTKAENIINTVTQSQQYIDDLLSKVDSTVAEEESKRIEELINTATSVDRIVSTVTQSQQYINDLKDKASNTAVEQQKRDLEELINTATSAERIITTVTESDKYVNDLLEKADSATVDATINNVKNELQNNINSVDGKVGEAVLEIDKTKESLSLKANKTEVYTKAETDTALNDKANQIDLNSVTERVSTTEAELRVQADQIATKVEKKTYETAIGSINDSLSGKADTTTVNGVIERVTTAESSIVQNAEAIATKVSDTTYQQDKKNLETRMTSAESSITQNAEGIALKANKTDVYTKGEVDGTIGAIEDQVSAVESELTVQAGQISSKVSKTDYEKDMTSVGTRLSSAESSIIQNADAIVQKVSKTEYAQDKKGITDRLSSAESSITQNAEAIALKASKTELTTGLSGKADNSTVTALSGKVSTVESELKVQADQIKQTVSKIEYDGTIEELQGAIDGKADSSSLTALSDRVTTAESAITQNADQIAAKVSNTTYQQDKKNLETRVTSAESAITQQAESISLKANKTDVYTKAEADSAVGAVSEKVSAVESELKVQAGQITQKVSKTDYDKAMNGVNERLTTAESNITQTAESIESKVSKTEYAEDKEGILTRLGTAETGISQNANAIALKASKTELTTGLAGKADSSTVSALTGRVSTAESELRVQAEQISQKVSKTEYSGDISDLQSAIDSKADESTLSALAQRVTTAESSITQTAEQITQKVSKTEYDKGLSGKADTSTVTALGTRLSTAETTLTQQAGQIALKASKTDVYTKSETDGKINSIQIGGRNLALNSNKEYINNSYQIAGYTPSELFETGEKYTVTICVTPAQGVTDFKLYVSSGYQQLAQLSVSGVNKQIVSATFIGKYTDGRVPTSPTHGYANLQIYRFPNNNTVTSNSTIHWIKVEKGTKATDWTPSPEDIEAKVSSVEAELQVHADAITQTVKKTDYDKTVQQLQTNISGKADSGTVSAITERLTTAEASIKTNADSIKQTVTKTEWTQDKQTINNSIANKADNSTVTSITNRLSTAEGSITTLSDQISLKASKTDVYTKNEVNSKVDSISVGGRNLITNSDFSETRNWGMSNYATYTSDGMNGKRAITVKRASPETASARVGATNSTLSMKDTIPKGTEFTLSAWVYVYDGGTYPALTDDVSSIFLRMWRKDDSTLWDVVNLRILRTQTKNGWVRLVGSGTTSYEAHGGSSSYPPQIGIYLSGYGMFKVSEVKLEYGNKATDWSPNPADLIERIESAEAEIKVNSDSIKQTVTKTDYTGEKLVSMINQTADSVKIAAKNINLTGAVTFSSLDSSTQTKIATIESTASTAKSTADAANSTATNASQLAAAIASGKMLYKDATFKTSSNSVKYYNNAGGTHLTVSRITKPSDCPSTSTHCMEIKVTGTTTSPSWGGFTFHQPSRANAKFIVKIIAKIPTGRNLTFSTNSIGDGGTNKWFTSTAGTGGWTEYIHEIKCGSSGSFGTTAFYYLTGGSNPSSTSPLIWYLSYATVYDVTETENDYDTAITTAQNTAANASSVATAAQTAANTANTKLSAWAHSSNTTLIDGSKIYTGSITAQQITSGAFKGVNFEAGGSGVSGLILAKDDSDDITFSASKNGVFAKNITFVDTVNFDGTFTTSRKSVLNSNGLTYSKGESSSSYSSEDEVSIGASGVVVKNTYSSSGGADSITSTTITNNSVTTGTLTTSGNVESKGFINSAGNITSRGGIFGATFIQHSANYGTPLEVGRYIDLHNAGSTNDVDVRLDTGNTRNRLRISGGADLSRYVEIGMGSNGSFLKDSPSGKSFQMRTDRLTYDGATVPHNWRQNFTPFIFSDTGNFNMVESWGEAVYLGDLVWIRGRVRGSRGGHSGSVYIGGLPVSCIAGYPALDIAFFGGVTASLGNGGFDIRAYLEGNASHSIITYSNKDTGGWHNLQCSHVTTGNMDISFSAIYRWR